MPGAATWTSSLRLKLRDGFNWMEGDEFWTELTMSSIYLRIGSVWKCARLKATWWAVRAAIKVLRLGVSVLCMVFAGVPECGNFLRFRVWLFFEIVPTTSTTLTMRTQENTASLSDNAGTRSLDLCFISYENIWNRQYLPWTDSDDNQSDVQPVSNPPQTGKRSKDEFDDPLVVCYDSMSLTYFVSLYTQRDLKSANHLVKRRTEGVRLNCWRNS